MFASDLLCHNYKMNDSTLNRLTPQHLFVLALCLQGFYLPISSVVGERSGIKDYAYLSNFLIQCNIFKNHFALRGEFNKFVELGV